MRGLVVIDGGFNQNQSSSFCYSTMLPIGGLRKNGYTLPSIVMGLRSNHLLPDYCEELIHLKFGLLKRSSIFACLVSIQRMGILYWLIMSSIGFLLVIWFLPSSLISKIFSILLKILLVLNLIRFHNKLGLRSIHFQNLFLNKL